MADTNYLSRVIKHPQFVLNENFILHPISALSTSRKIIKNNLPLTDCIKKLTGDTTENIKRYYEDIANNSELEKYLQTQFDEYNSYINSKDFKISKFFKENPAGRLNRPSQGHAGFFLYILVRSLKPEFFLETGVSAGESSTYILQAMHDNNFGKLFSIDFPSAIVEKGLTTIMPEGKTSGWAIPENLKDRWELSLGKSEELLPKILERQKKIDVFMHDSVHTYDHMMFEYTTSWDFIKKNGLLLSDDIVVMNGKGHSPFVDFAESKQKEIVVYNVLGGLRK
jgi:hypothetical protein